MPKLIRDVTQSLAAQMSALDELESKTYAEFNDILNPFDPGIPISEQFKNDPEKMQKLVAAQAKMQEQREFRLELTDELLQAKPEQKEAFWKEYSKNPADQAIFENFIARMDEFPDPNTSKEALLSSKADILKIMAFESGSELIMKINLNMEGKKLVIKEDEDYVCEMQEEQTKFFHKQGHDAEHKAKIKEYSGNDDEQLKSLYKHEKHKHKKGEVADLKGLNILVPTPDPTSLLMNVAKDKDGKVMLSITPPYRALFHELCHAHRDLKGANKRMFTIPDKYRGLYSKSAEELWTINLGKSSEKTLSQEDGIPGRITHSGFSMHVVNNNLTTNKDPEQAPHSDAKISESILGTRAMLGESDFSGIRYHSDETMTLAIEKQKGEKVDRFKAEGSAFGVFITGGDWVSPSFKDAQLSEKSYISDCEISNGNFLNVNFTKSTFQNVNAKDTDFSNANLSGSKLVRSTFENCVFKNANLQNINFTNKVVFVGNTDMSGADLRGANLSGVDLSGVDLTGADLRGANLSGAKLDGAILTGAKIDGTKLDGATMQYARVGQIGFTAAMHLHKMRTEQQTQPALGQANDSLKAVNSLVDALSDLASNEMQEKAARKEQTGFKQALLFSSMPMRVSKTEKAQIALNVISELKQASTLPSPNREDAILKIIDKGIAENNAAHKFKPSDPKNSRLSNLLEQAKSMIEKPDNKADNKQQLKS